MVHTTLICVGIARRTVITPTTSNPLNVVLYIDTETREATLFYRPDGGQKRRVDFSWEEGQTQMGFICDRVATEPVAE